ncbi:hypothetical protein ACHWQZ_G007937 [Mnemiopsis leidyi]
MQNMKTIIRTLLICSLFIESIDCRPGFQMKRLKGVVDLDDKHDIKNLIGVLKNYLHNKEDGTDTLLEEDERSAVEESGQIPSTGPLVQEAHAGLNPDVRVMRYKVIFYTMDHPLSEVRKWMKKGFNAWSNPKIDNYLRRWGCPTLEFVETTNDDYDFAINFDYEFFNRFNRHLSKYSREDSTIFINDYKDLRREWIAHAVAYDTCEMLGCQCTKHGQNEIMSCMSDDWTVYQPTEHDLRTMAAALGCRTPNIW